MSDAPSASSGGPELLAPAGDFDTALAAFAAGADAVYCGLAEFSARAFAKNFTFEQLDQLLRVARASVPARKVYVTFNTLVDEADFARAARTLARLEALGPDGVIVQDLGIARLCRRHFPGLVLHASTQMVAHNLEGVLELRDLGFARVVLARELSLAEVASIAKRCGGVELECFIHGALCYSVSGLCLFSALERDRSGNRGACAYCCRLPCGASAEGASFPFSMKDLRLGEDVRRLADAGVVSLKIEGRMKSPLYVASVTRYYRGLLDGARDVTTADLETVFARRTTELYLDGEPKESPIDPVSLGHLGAAVGAVKRITRDREGRRWLRFHTTRALEKHDGLQFPSPDGGKPLGFGISEMRQAISRVPVFEVAAGADVEVLLPPEIEELKTGSTVYCSMSNAVRRRFPVPAFRPSDYPGLRALDVEVTLAPDGLTARVAGTVQVSLDVALAPARNPDATFASVEKAFAKLGGTPYRLGRLTLVDPDRLFAPPHALNDLRRELVEKLVAADEAVLEAKISAAVDDEATVEVPLPVPLRSVRLRAGQELPDGDFDEVVVAVSSDTLESALAPYAAAPSLRLGLPVYTSEPDFNRLRVAVKRFLRAGYVKWEASDLATVRMLRALGVTDLTADWTLYCFNAQALAVASELGVRGFVASPENNRENLQYLVESGFPVAFLEQQSTPLFVSKTRPAGVADGAETSRITDARGGELVVTRRDGLWITTRPVPRTFAVPDGAPSRLDLSWEAT